jgi:putative colanic acid biosynthesis acetyltransferase WcaF
VTTAVGVVRRRLGGFTGAGYDKGRSLAWQAAWFATQHLIFAKWWFPARLRPRVLRAFGATIGRDVLIRHGVRVHWPWKLTIGNDCWIGEDASLLNLEPITIGSDVCISQGAFLCTGSHDRRSPTFEFDNGPITIGDGAWVAARAIVLRGTTMYEGTIVGAGAVVARDVERGEAVLSSSTRVRLR